MRQGWCKRTAKVRSAGTGVARVALGWGGYYAPAACECMGVPLPVSPNESWALPNPSAAVNWLPHTAANCQSEACFATFARNCAFVFESKTVLSNTIHGSASFLFLSSTLLSTVLPSAVLASTVLPSHLCRVVPRRQPPLHRSSSPLLRWDLPAKLV